MPNLLKIPDAGTRPTSRRQTGPRRRRRKRSAARNRSAAAAQILSVTACPLRAERGQLERCYGILLESQGHNLALTFLFLQYGKQPPCYLTLSSECAIRSTAELHFCLSETQILPVRGTEAADRSSKAAKEALRRFVSVSCTGFAS